MAQLVNLAQGPLIGDAACLADTAHFDLMRATLRLEVAGLELAPEVAQAIETVAAFASTLTAIADSIGHQAVSHHLGTCDDG